MARRLSVYQTVTTGGLQVHTIMGPLIYKSNPSGTHPGDTRAPHLHSCLYTGQRDPANLGSAVERHGGEGKCAGARAPTHGCANGQIPRLCDRFHPRTVTHGHEAAPIWCNGAVILQPARPELTFSERAESLRISGGQIGERLTGLEPGSATAKCCATGSGSRGGLMGAARFPGRALRTACTTFNARGRCVLGATPRGVRDSSAGDPASPWTAH